MIGFFTRCGGIGCLLFLMAGCHQTPQQKLVGRWYNDDMSIRFRSDGYVAVFTRSGRAEGWYDFTGTQNSTARNATENLVLHVLRDGQPRRMVFDADFLGTDRLKLSDLTPTSKRTVDPAPEFAVLRREEPIPPQQNR